MTRYSTRYYDPPVRFRTVITRADIEAFAQGGQTTYVLGEQSTITDEAREQALKLGIAIQSGDQKPKPASPAPAASAPAPASRAQATAAVAAAPAPALPNQARPAPFAVPAGHAARAPAAPASPATIIEAVVAELHARRVTPSVALIQEVVTSVNAALASARA